VTSVLDILINEVASVLGISAAEVKSKFTTEQLEELLSLSLCEPDSTGGVPFDTAQPPCEEPSPAANLLPPVEVAITPNIPTSNVERCIENVAEVNSQIAAQNENYSNHRLLLAKLIEYRDNYQTMLYYFDERSKEAARIIGEFGPIVTEVNRLTENLFFLRAKVRELDGQSNSVLNFQNDSQAQLIILNQEIQKTEDLLRDQQLILEIKKSNLPIFSDVNFQNAYETLSEADYSDTSVSSYLADIYNGYLSNSQLDSIKTQLEDYSSCIKAKVEFNGTPESIQQAVESNYFSFTLDFPQLEFIQTQKEKVDPNTGEDYTEDTFFLVKTNPLLQKNSFFSNYSAVTVRDYFSQNSSPPTGTLYTKYYNLFEDPENNFFTLAERGLSSSGGDVDPKLKDSDTSIKKEKNSDYYIKDFDIMSAFYKNFDERFEARKEQRRDEVIEPARAGIRLAMQTIAKREVQVLLAVAGVANKLPKDSQALGTIAGKLGPEANGFAQRLQELDSEINRIQALLEELKPTPQKIKQLLKEKSPECFSKEPEPADDSNPDCSGAKSKLGIDPFFTETLGGCDPTLPTQNQICYWIEFAKVASLMGLLPLPNLPNVTKLRYWPVGLLIPSPVGLIKIPLPIIWIPLVTISSPLGNVVIFLTANGIFISPVVFFISSSGFKQHILTLKGPSKKFGYSAEDASIKTGIQSSVFLLAAKDTATRLTKEASDGKYYSFSEEQRKQIIKQQNLLAASEQAANQNNNSIKKDKIAREKKNFERATTNFTENEKLRKILDAVDSVKDTVDDAKHALLNRIDELGKPVLASCNRIKEKISARQAELLSQLKKALAENDLDRAKQLRSEMQSDGAQLVDKIEAIKKDMMDYFDRIEFPKIVIPKDASTLEPKINPLTEFLSRISEFSSIYRTQFYAKDDSKVRKILSIQLAKSKQKIKAKVSKRTSSDGTLDIEKDQDKIKKALKDAGKTVVDSVSGKGTTGSVAEQQTKIDSAKAALDKENDTAKRTKIRRDLEKQQALLSEILEQEKIKQSLAITPAVLASLSQLSIDFNPFAPCCNKKSFSPDLSVSPALAVFASAGLLLNSYIDSLTAADLKALFGGKSKVTAQEIAASFLSIIKKAIPESLEIPLPNLNLATFASSFAGLLTSLFEVKVPNLAAQPALPASITIDLNLLKRPLASLLIEYLIDSLPDPTPATPVNTGPSTNAATNVSKNEIAGVTGKTAEPGGKSKLDRNIQIVDCEPDTSGDSVLSGGSSTFAPSAFSSSNVIVNSSKDVLPNFSTLETDFSSVNPSDLTAILKNFIDLRFGQVEKLLDPFYKVLITLKGAKGVNLNLLEEAQYKLPPYGPAAKQIFNSITKIKQQIPRSATVNKIDLQAVEAGAKLLKTVLSPIANSPLPAAIVAGAGATDSLLPAAKVPSVDATTGGISTKDVKVASFALRSLHPLLTQEDLPPWERLTGKNLLFLLFLDEFIANGADKLGFFRAYI
jgi:hypothetical protein